jgi:hypothetical protein
MTKAIHSEAIETFPFDRMARAMEILRWQPITQENSALLRLEAARMLRDMNERKGCSKVGSGALEVDRDGTVSFMAKSGKRKESLEAWEAAGH